MSYIVSKYPNGTFSWADVASTDFATTKQFFSSLLGWTSVDMPTGEGKPDYTMFYLGEHTVAGGAPTYTPELPSYWSNFVSVDNIDTVIANVEKHGGKVLMPPMDVFDSGRMATIQDPTGAALSLWQAKNHIGAHIVNTVGAMCWNELYTPDIKTAQTFYGALFGWTFDTDENDGYVSIKNNGRANGGMFALTKEMEGMPPNWTVYFTVANLKDSLEQVTKLGGSIHMPPKNIGVGSIAMIADPTGASCMVMEMSVPPSEWIE